MDVETILSKYPKKREFVLEILHELQNNHPQNYLTKETIKLVAQQLELPLSQIYGVIGYYSMLSIKPRGEFILCVCKSPVCRMMGSVSVSDQLKSLLKIDINQTTSDGLFTLEEVECLGRCDEAPSMMINKDYYGNLTPDKILKIINDIKNQKLPENDK
ncbi:MAG: NAD(P)H-dependent oxidoreductase subunit E [Tenuifilaceae bacterium]